MHRNTFPVFASGRFGRFHFLVRVLMPLLVFGQTLGRDETFAASFALVRFIVIDLLMILQVTDSRETRTAVAALEESIVNVRS